MKKIPIILSLLCFACQTSQKEEVDLKTLKDDVFEIHDEIMPKMGDLRRTRKDLMLQAESLKSSDSLEVVVLLNASDQIEAANDMMMNWMQNFDSNFEGSDEEILKYLSAQKASIEKVRTKMNESWERGKRVLENN